MFKDRIDAGKQLAEKLLKLKDDQLVVLAIPRGGLPLAEIVAKTLKAPLDVALTKKIAHPYHKEYAIGAVSLEGKVLTDTMGISKSYVEKETARIRKELQQRYDQYYKKRSPQNIKNKTVIIVDDGIATGNTILATVKVVSEQQPRKIIVAIPVAPSSAIEKLERAPKVDEVICLQIPLDFQAVGQFYYEFGQVSDEEAIGILNSFPG